MKSLVIKTLQKVGRKMFPQDSRFSPEIRALQVSLYNKWRQDCKRNLPLPELQETGFRVFSEFEEDGLLLYIFSILGMGSKQFVDIGSADGIGSNCANLAINWGWHGLFIDGNPNSIARGNKYYQNHPDTTLYPPKFHCEYINAENINEIISKNGIEGDVELLNIDIDGNDYWVWKALKVINPKVVIIETKVEFGLHPVVVPYDPDYVYPPKSHSEYFGASPIAMEKLANEKGYRLVGSNWYGFNTIYIKKGLAEDVFPAVPVEKILSHPRNAQRQKLFEPIEDWEYVRV